MADARSILLNLIGKESVSPAAKKASDAVDDLGDELRDTAKDAKNLDGEIDDLKKSLVELAAAYRVAGSAAERVDIAKSIRGKERQLREQTKIAKILADAGADAATGFVTKFVGRLGPLIVSKTGGALSPAMAAAAAGPAAVLATTLGAAAAGAIIGGSAGVGVIGGLMVAAKHSAVQASAKSLGAEITRSLQIDAAAFVPAAQEAIGILRTEFAKARGDIADIFSASSTFVRPLTEGAGRAIRGIVAGIRDLAVKAGPVINVISEGMGRLGEAIGKGLSSLSDNSEDAAHALGVMFVVLEAGAAAALRAIDALTELYSVMRLIGAARNADIAAVGAWVAGQGEASESTANFSEDLQTLLAGFRAATAATSASTSQLRSWEDQMRANRDQTMANFNAEIAYQQAIDDASAARKENGKTLDINTQKGRDNMTALLNLASAAKANADSIRALTGSEDLAAKATESSRKAFVAQAHAMGMSIPKAQELATRLFGIPNVTRTVTVITAEAEENLRTVAALIRAIKSKRVVITVDRRGRESTRSEGRSVPIGELGGREYGGPVKAGHAYVVGEKRPEVFVPDRDGRILPSIERYKTSQGGQPERRAPAAMSEERIARALARVLSGLSLQIDDRRARLATVYARKG